MFKELVDLSKSCTINLTISHEHDDQMKVILLPKPGKEGENPALSTPLLLEGTAEELDDKFSEIIASYTNTRTSLAEALASSQEIMIAAQKQATEIAAKKIAEKSGNATAKGTSVGNSIPDKSGLVKNNDDVASSSTKKVDDDLNLFD